MDAAAVCSVAALLTVIPNRSQFFSEESLTLNCQPLGNLLDWKVMRNTSKQTNEEPCPSTNTTDKSSCHLDYLIASDSGVYWCEGPGFWTSNTINISVTGGHVILEVPVFPVVEGNKVTLFCRQKSRNPSSINSSHILKGTFYKDGVSVENTSEGVLSITNVSKSDQGHYSCYSGNGSSPQSWLAVKGQSVGLDDEAPPLTNLLCILSPVGVLLLTTVFLVVFCCHRERKAKKEASVLYEDIIITPVVQRKQQRKVKRLTIQSQSGRLAPSSGLTTLRKVDKGLGRWSSGIQVEVVVETAAPASW